MRPKRSPKEGTSEGIKGSRGRGATQRWKRMQGWKEDAKLLSVDGHGIFRSWKRKKTTFLKSLEEGWPCGHLAFSPLEQTAYIRPAQLEENLFSCWFYKNTLRIYGQHKLEIRSWVSGKNLGKNWGKGRYESSLS